MERYNREIGRILPSDCNVEHTKFSRYLTKNIYYINNTVSEYLEAAPHLVFLSLSCYDFVSRLLFNQNGGIYNFKVRAEKFCRHAQGSNRTKGKNITRTNYIVYRKLHNLSSTSDKQITKLFNLREGLYIVKDMYPNLATIVFLTIFNKGKKMNEI